jgi:prevent-host-death family protein
MTRVDSLDDALERVAEGQRVVLTVKGKEVALLSVEDLKYLEEMEDYLDLEAVRKAKAEPGPNIPYEQVRRELGLE